MSARINASSLVDGGEVLHLQTGTRERLTISVTMKADGTRTFRAWVFWRDEHGVWKPSRRGWRGSLGIVDLERIASAFTSVAGAARARRATKRTSKKTERHE